MASIKFPKQKQEELKEILISEYSSLELGQLLYALLIESEGFEIGFTKEEYQSLIDKFGKNGIGVNFCGLIANIAMNADFSRSAEYLKDVHCKNLFIGKEQKNKQKYCSKTSLPAGWADDSYTERIDEKIDEIAKFHPPPEFVQRLYAKFINETRTLCIWLGDALKKC